MMFKNGMILLFFTGFVLNSIRKTNADNLPTAVALGGAIVAVEEDEAQEQLKIQTQRDFEFSNLLNMLGLKDLYTDEEIAEARGKYNKKHKFLKQLYPLLIGAVLAKTVVIPLVLKMLTALSTSSFIMAKIALAASGLVALKWIFADSVKERTHLEIVHLPAKGGGSSFGHNNLDWNDLSWSGSNYVDTKITQKPRFKYIPLGGGTEGFQNSLTGNKVNGGANTYRYNYGGSLDGRPFL